MDYGNDRVSPLLWNFPFKPDEGGESVELQQNGPFFFESEVQQLHGEGRPAPLLFVFTIAFTVVVTFSSLGSIPRILATGCCGSRFRMGFSMSNLACLI